MTKVYQLGTDQEFLYDLPPAEAVVAAYERSRRNNTRSKDWWAYPKPQDHPHYRRGRWGHHCGDFSARA